MPGGFKRLPAAFFRQAGGREPVREWLKALDPRPIARSWVTTFAIWSSPGRSACRCAAASAAEVRSSLTGGRIGRVIFCVSAGHAVLLHAFVKKSQKTPPAELEPARRRMKEVTS